MATKKLLALIMCLLPSCVLDALDGHIDSFENCCAALTKKGMRECAAQFMEPGDCWEVSCTGIGHVTDVYVQPDGEVVATCPF